MRKQPILAIFVFCVIVLFVGGCGDEANVDSQVPSKQSNLKAKEGQPSQLPVQNLKQDDKPDADDTGIKSDGSASENKILRSNEFSENDAEQDGQATDNTGQTVEEVFGDVINAFQQMKKERAERVRKEYVIDAEEIKKVRMMYSKDMSGGEHIVVTPYNDHKLSAKLKAFMPIFEKMAETKSHHHGFLYLAENPEAEKWELNGITWCTSFARQTNNTPHRLCYDPQLVHYGHASVDDLAKMTQAQFNDFVIKEIKDPSCDH